MHISSKDVYDHVGENLRYYLDWRAKLLAGYFVIMAAHVVELSWTLKNHPNLAFVVPVSACLSTILFRFLDYRNRDAYRGCIEVGAAIEEQSEIQCVGLYTNFNKEATFSHSYVLDSFFVLCFIGCVAMAILLYRNNGALP
jgi:hypothetical protein